MLEVGGEASHSRAEVRRISSWFCKSGVGAGAAGVGAFGPLSKHEQCVQAQSEGSEFLQEGSSAVKRLCPQSKAKPSTRVRTLFTAAL